MKREVLFIGGSRDGATILRPPTGLRPVYRVRKEVPWAEGLRANACDRGQGPYGDICVETYELRQFAFTLDGRLERVYEVYVIEGTPYPMADKTVAEIIERLRGIYPVSRKVILGEKQ